MVKQLVKSLGSNHPNRAKHTRTWRQHNIVKNRAQQIIYKAVRRGKLLRLVFCQLCLSPKRIEAHHQNYAKPRDVVWLCHGCHRSIEGRDGKNTPYAHRIERERKQGGVRVKP